MLDEAQSLDSLSSIWDRPIRSMDCGVYGPAHLLDNLSATWERAKISNDMIRFMMSSFLVLSEPLNGFSRKNFDHPHAQT